MPFYAASSTGLSGDVIANLPMQAFREKLNLLLPTTSHSTLLNISDNLIVPEEIRAVVSSMHADFILHSGSYALNLPSGTIQRINTEMKGIDIPAAIFDIAHRHVLKLVFENTYSRFLSVHPVKQPKQKSMMARSFSVLKTSAIELDHAV